MSVPLTRSGCESGIHAVWLGIRDYSGSRVAGALSNPIEREYHGIWYLLIVS